MRSLIHDRIVPAVEQKDFDTFAQSLTEYNRLAGTHYHEVQPGDYSSELNAERLEIMRQAGATGRGQSSWGPGLFAVFPDESAVQSFIDSAKLPGCILRVAKVKSA
jgi:predicted sugar kinase